MKQIEEIIRNTTEEEQEKVDWTKAWSTWITDRRKTKNTSNGDKESWRMKRYLPCLFPKCMAF